VDLNTIKTHILQHLLHGGQPVPFRGGIKQVQVIRYLLHWWGWAHYIIIIHTIRLTRPDISAFIQ
jgi:hypothetical protein